MSHYCGVFIFGFISNGTLLSVVESSGKYAFAVRLAFGKPVQDTRSVGWKSFVWGRGYPMA